MVDEVPVEEVETSILEEFPVTSFPVPRRRGRSPIPVSHRLPAPSSAVPQLPPPASSASRISAWAKGLGRLNPLASFMQIYLQGLEQLPPETRETPAASGSQLSENVAKGIQAFKERMSVPPGGIAQLPGRHRVYHGTVSEKGQFPLSETEMDWEHEKHYTTKRSDAEQLNRLLGPHFAKTPDIANRFAGGLYQWRSVSGDPNDPGGQVIPADISTRLKKIYQPSRPFKSPFAQGEQIAGYSPLGDAEAISNDMFDVVFSDPRNKQLFLDMAERKHAHKPQPNTMASHGKAYDSIMDGTFNLLEETDRPLNTKNIDTDKPQLMGRFVREILGTDLLYGSSRQRKHVVDEYKRILGEQGFEGIEYENTAPKEIEGLRGDPEKLRSFVVFDPFTGARSPFAPEGRNWARGGFVDKPLYEEKRML